MSHLNRPFDFTASGDQDMGKIILSYMIQMIHALGVSIIAEGVETKEQADFLDRLGCTEMQGYYFFKPLTVNDFEAVDHKISAE